MSENPNVVAALRQYAATYGVPANVYYPGCGSDWSPSVAFPTSFIVYLDPNEDELQKIRLHLVDCHTVHRKAETMPSGGCYELVIDIHSHAPFEEELRHMLRGNHLFIATKGSDKAFEHPKLKLVAAIPWRTERNEDGIRGIETENLEKYYDVDPNAPAIHFSNKRKIKAAFYVFERIA